jgi:hypothetical protein
MKNILTCLLLVALVAVLALNAVARFSAKSEPQLAHMVFFTLKDHSQEAREKFVASCQKYLSNHKGTVYFSVGTIADEVEEGVGVKDFDVALHLIFETKEDKAAYLVDPRHKQFGAENGKLFAKVRVFDSYLVKK